MGSDPAFAAGNLESTSMDSTSRIVVRTWVKEGIAKGRRSLRCRRELARPFCAGFEVVRLRAEDLLPSCSCTMLASRLWRSAVSLALLGRWD